VKKQIKTALKFFYFALIIFVYIHICGCLFWVVINSNDNVEYVPAMDFIDSSKSELYRKADGSKQHWSFQYSVVLYYALACIGGNELAPTDLNEMLMIIVMNIIGALIKVMLFGEIAVLMGSITAGESNQQAVIDTANVAMSNIDLPEDMRKAVREYFLKV
jgi:hypothetical protein